MIEIQIIITGGKWKGTKYHKSHFINVYDSYVSRYYYLRHYSIKIIVSTVCKILIYRFVTLCQPLCICDESFFCCCLTIRWLLFCLITFLFKTLIILICCLCFYRFFLWYSFFISISGIYACDIQDNVF